MQITWIKNTNFYAADIVSGVQKCGQLHKRVT